MTLAQKARLLKLEKTYGTKADRVCELMLVQFSPDNITGVSFIVDSDGRICSAEQLPARMMSLAETKRETI